MSLKIRTRHVVTLLELSGRIGLGEPQTLLTDAVHQALKEGAINLVLDLTHLAYMDSTGLAELTAAYKLAQSHHCEFKLLHLPPRIADLLQITHLTSTFDIFTNESEAATTFRH